MLTPTLLAQIMQCPLPRAQRWTAPLNAAMQRFDIRMLLRQAHFLAQLGHESLSLGRVEESLSYSRARLLEVFGHRVTAAQAPVLAYQPEKLGNRIYAERNGNGDEPSGDGYLFRGRGPLQHTGRGNYAHIGTRIGQPLEQQPQLLLVPEHGAMAAAAYWSDMGLNAHADRDDVLAVSRGVNLGSPRSRRTPNGLADRTRRTSLAIRVLGAAA